MRTLIRLLFLVMFAAANVPAQTSTAPLKPPVGVPADAKLFNGRWYRIYLEKVGWKSAREKCHRLGGQLAVVPDEPTNAFIKELGGGPRLWLGATDEKVEGHWIWVDGTPMTFKAWARRSPDNAKRREHYLALWGERGEWNDAAEDKGGTAGYICEWKPK